MKYPAKNTVRREEIKDDNSKSDTKNTENKRFVKNTTTTIYKYKKRETER